MIKTSAGALGKRASIRVMIWCLGLSGLGTVSPLMAQDILIDGATGPATATSPSEIVTTPLAPPPPSPAEARRLVRASRAYKAAKAQAEQAADGAMPAPVMMPVAPSLSMPVPMQSSDTALSNPSDCPSGSVDAWHLPPELPRDLAAHARPGQCFTRLLKAPVTEAYNERVMVAESRRVSRTIPAVTEWRDQQVLVSPSRSESFEVAAVTHRVWETVVVQPESMREELIPAVYETRPERVLVRPAHQEWIETEGVRTGAALVTSNDYQPARYRDTGVLTWPGKSDQDMQVSAQTQDYYRRGSAQIVYCLKDFPPEYRTEERRVLVRPEQVRHVTVPAVTRKVERDVVDVPYHVESREIPAVYRTERVQVVVQPAREEFSEIPAIYKDVTRQRIVRPAEPVWAEILCDRNATPSKVREIQSALTRKGYYRGKLTGRIDQPTVAAMQRFEADQGLPQGQISLDAVRALGVSL